jgi:hypothetical protein
MYPGEVSDSAISRGIDRALYMLRNAAVLEVVDVDSQITVRVTNNCGHKLPTGYPEGRRAWLNVQFYDGTMSLISESATYDTATGVLGHDPEAKIYEIEPATSGIPTLPDSSLFHFVLNNTVLKDNRIPPRGFTNTAYDAFGGSPVAYTYADGQYWDDTVYDIPMGAVTAKIALYYQSTSKEFVEFLRDENTTNTKGQELFDLWNNNGKCPPEVMDSLTFDLTIAAVQDPGADLPKTYLAQNHPNPFSSSTTIGFSLATESRVNLSVYTVEGRRVKVLIDRHLASGVHQATWTGDDDRGRPVAPGIYFYRLEADGSEFRRKMPKLQ